MAYPKHRKKFILFNASLTPNYPVGGGDILFAVNKNYAEVIPVDEIIKVAKDLGFRNPELKVNAVTRLGTMLGFSSEQTAAVKTELGDATLHILSYNTGEY